MVSLNIMEIERFAISDGPGIRTTVFLQGCPLYCPWCSNPESQKIKTHLFHLESKCIGCRRCENVCKQNAIKFKENKFTFNENLCIFCKDCALKCIQNAISFVGEKVSISDIISEIEKDDDYYKSSGGGVTISGGEPFVQFEGFFELCKRLKEKNYHVCVETTGQTTIDKCNKISDYIDLFLIDYKHSNSKKLKEVTGGDLEIIETTIKTLLNNKSNQVIIRIPVIPNFNHTKEDMNQIFKRLEELNVTEVHLLPFHNFGKTKYKQMRKDYFYESVPSLNKKDLEIYLKDKWNFKLYIK